MSEQLLDQIYQALQGHDLEILFDGDHKSSALFVGNGESQVVISTLDMQPYEQEDQ